MGLSLGHMIVILIIVVVIWGPSRLHNVGRGVGEMVRGFKKGLHGDDEIDVTHTSRNLSSPHENDPQIRDAQVDPFSTPNSTESRSKETTGRKS